MDEDNHLNILTLATLLLNKTDTKVTSFSEKLFFALIAFTFRKFISIQFTQTVL